MAAPAEETFYRKSHVRYGAHCPGVVELTFKDRKRYVALTGMIVNLSVTGCLFSNVGAPWSATGFDTAGQSIFDLVEETCRVHMPWTDTDCVGRIRRSGKFIVGIQFNKPLKEDLVRLIASLEPNRIRRFSPRSAEKYNRILPLPRATS